MKILSIIFLLLGAMVSANFCVAQTQTTAIKLYNGQRIARPIDLPMVKVSEFEVHLKQLQLYPTGMIYGDTQTLTKLGNYLKNNPEGKQLWQKQTEITTEVLNKWDFLRNKSFSSNRYIYSLGELEDLSMVYLFTGHPILGQFIKAHLLQVASLPLDFWVHAELRGLNPQQPSGMLETAVACTGVAAALSVSESILTKNEKELIDTALLQKGLIPTLNWLKTPQVSNFTAVIGSGALVAAHYLNNNEGKEKAKKAIARFVNESIEKDGSYGEGLSYFNFPIGSLLSGILCLSKQERQAVFSESELKKSSEWIVYSYFFNASLENKSTPKVIHFGDNPYSDEHSYFTTPNTATNIITANLYQDSLAYWILKKLNRKQTLKEMLLTFSSPSEFLPPPKSPETSQLPLLKVFDSGDCYIRSSWKDNGIVLGLRSGDGSRIKFSHQRPELNSICMGAYGEYFIVSPGSASYRSPIHTLYDISTKAANTIAIDDMNQLFPGKGTNPWNKKLDNSNFWMEGKPKSKVIFSKIGKIADVLVNEAAEAYFPKMKNATRTIIFVKDPGYFVMMDKLETSENTSHKFSWRIHLNNRDDKGLLKKINENQWHLDRPLADLDIHVFSDKKVNSTIGKGYMHGEDRDYSPGGKYEGKEGSSTELEIFNAEKTNSLTYYTILYPTQNNMIAPKVRYKKNTISIGNDKVVFGGNVYIIMTKGKVEKIELK
jgi:hypothetical protein